MSDENEPEVTIESIDQTLDYLAKAAQITDLSKAYGGTAVDSYGHVDERGKTSGGYADKGDMGSLDSMMIGKMEASLIDAGFPAEAIAAFMRGKQEEEEESEEEMKGKFGKPADSSGSVTTGGRPRAGGGMGKSMDAFGEDQAIADAIDVSPFLEALVQRTTERLDGLAKSQADSHGEQTEVNRHMAAAVVGIGHLIKSQQAVIQELGHRLGMVERQPNAPKGHTQLTGAQPIRKSFGHYGTEGGGAQGVEQLHKSEVVSTLTYMNLEKGIKDIGGVPTYEIAALYEAGGGLPRAALGAVDRFLKSHPNEAQLARHYR